MRRAHPAAFVTGKPITAGKGICIGGFANCVNGVVDIQSPEDCEGQVLPVVDEAGEPIDECGTTPMTIVMGK